MSFERGGRYYDDVVGDFGGSSGAAGKRTLTAQLQLRASEAAPVAPGEVDTGSYMGLSESSVTAQSIAAGGLTGSSTALPYADQIQASFGRHSIAGIDAHVGGPAAAASDALGAHGYATGSSVAFARSPDLHTAAHEAAHVIQQRAGVHLKGGMGARGDAHEQHADAVADAVVRGESAEALLDQYSGSGGSDAVQCDFTETRAIPGGHSSFDIDLRTRTTGGAASPIKSGMDGFIRFVPGVGDQNSNTITMVQVAKLTDLGGTDIRAASEPANIHPRGHLGDRGLRTEADAATGVEGGYATDLRHDLQAPGTAASPRYPFQPELPGATGHGSTQQPAQYGGGIGGRTGETPGFKRSDLDEDRKSATMYDYPGVPGTTWNLDFEFQTVARGEDTQHDYGTVTWGFGLRAGAVTNEHMNVLAGATATFTESLERHRDFYVHEPVTIYFAFDDDAVAGAELAKVTGLAEYLRRNPACLMTLDGFADNIGNAAYNVNLSQRRVTKTRDALIAAHAGFPAANIVANTVVAGGGHGASNDATEAPASDTPAGTGDQGGNAVNGADQTREANRQFNRRVTITFSHPAGTGPTAAGGVASPP